jgi:sigma-B regulation protein RsbU (phosphoserine phosphatase)
MQDYLANFRERNQQKLSDSDDVDRRLIELSALFEISQTLNSSLNLQSILNNVLLVPMGRMMLGKGIILLKTDDNQFRVETAKGLPIGLRGKDIHISDIPQHPVFVSNLKAKTEWKTFFNEFNIELLIPLIARSDILGIIGFSRKINKEDFTENEIDFLTSLTNIATTSIENALVFEKIKGINRQLDHRVQELNTLFDIGKELNLSLEKEKILKLLSYALMGQVTVNSFIIVTKEDDHFHASLVKGNMFSIIEGSECEELCHKSSFITTPYKSEDDSEFDNFLNDLGIRVIVPMLLQNEKKGYIFLAEKVTNNEYTDSDLEFLQTLGNIAIISIENARLFQEAIEKQKLEEELSLARNIQNRLLPKKMPQLDKLTLHGLNVPSKFVGGDYFDIILLDDHTIALTIADVSGKGMPAALLMSHLQASLHSLIDDRFSLDKLVSRINKVIYNNTDMEKYITFFYGQIDYNTSEICFVNAGHNPPYLLHENGTIEELFEGGIILGMMPDVEYEIGKRNLRHGDLLLLYTDGVTETMNENEDEFEEKRVIAFLKEHCVNKSPEQINSELLEQLRTFAGGTPQTDDITMLTLRYI